MKYVSTRGQAPELGFEDVLMAGLARDGGLYVPAAWPVLSKVAIAGLAGKPYPEAAYTVMAPFIGDDFPQAELRAILTEAYATFRHPAVAPLVQLSPGSWLLELFHGPTLAFKDIAMQVLSRLMDRTLAKRGKRATILGATSGDTGGAAIEAFRGLDAIDIFILFPKGRVSDVQRRQMTTATEKNVHAIAVEGTFDDCQNIVKALFNDLAWRDKMDLAGVNSINWARVMAQIVYYFTSAVALGAPQRKVRFSVPTGNFGDIFAGYAASKMGLPIERLIIATNENDILTRMAASGRYEPRNVKATQSPSMDIQISSNFERLLFELSGRDAGRVREFMQDLAKNNVAVLTKGERNRFDELFSAHFASEQLTKAMISQACGECEIVVDPHTAVGLVAAGKQGFSTGSPIITLATAHPAKFPDAVKAAIGREPVEPETVTRQKNLKQQFTVVANSAADVARLIETKARATRKPA